MDTAWLPQGHHWNLHIEQERLLDAGSFTGGGWKLLWHTTESRWDQLDAMVDVLREKRAAPHLVIGGRAGREHPTVVQCVSFKRAGRALANDGSDGFQTNRANVIQVEICGFASESHLWNDARYKALANLAKLIMHRVPVLNVAAQDFSRPHRMSDSEFVEARGHVGHSMAPDNDHSDPGRFREGALVNFIRDVPPGGWDL